MNDVIVRYRTAEVIDAVVRDVIGIFDVRWSTFTSWTCSCNDDTCGHVAAVRHHLALEVAS